MIRALIVEDEEPARRALRRRLEAEPDFDVIGDCASAGEALEAVRRLRPDVVLLDVELPGQDGFQLLEELGSTPPAVVFVTAHDHYALRAFDAHAVDYLLKPFDDDRFAQALARVRRHCASGRSAGSLQALAAALRELRPEGAGTPPLDRLVVRSAPGRMVVLKTGEIDWIEAEGDYVRIHSGARSWLVHKSLQELERRLDGRTFARVHRSAIANLERVRELLSRDGRDAELLLDGDVRLRLSRTHRERVEALLGEKL